MFTPSCIFPDKLSASVYACVIDISDGFIFSDEVELMPQPEALAAQRVANVLVNRHYLGTYNRLDCILYVVNRRNDADWRDSTKAYGLRDLFEMWDADIWVVAGYAWQIFEWDRNFRYCGRCGVETAVVAGERARKCEDCGLVSYPRISPSMIVLVQKDDQILLARNARFPRPFYSILAGFMEPGETLYECVAREVYEEVKLKVRNIRFYDSQYWPMSGSLMLGCFAEYASGEIQIDETELSHAAWFSVNALPPIPSKRSIAGKMIDLFIRQQLERC